MITLKNFMALMPYTIASFEEDGWVQVFDFRTDAQYLVSSGGTLTLGGDLIPGLTSSEGLMNHEVKYIEVEGEGPYQVFSIYVD